MHSAFHKLFKKSNKLFLPLISVAFLHLSTKPVFNVDAVGENVSSEITMKNGSLIAKNL